MNILLTGSHGLVGSALIPRLEKDGHKIYRLVRQNARIDKNEAYWNADTGSLDKSALTQWKLDAAIHLGGESIASGRWNKTRKKRMRDSRVNGTRVLAETLGHLENPPKVLICASAIGYYGTRGDQILTEKDAPGETFLAGLCKDWEAARQPAVSKGIRVVNLRIGVVLSREGGALKKMALPFKLGFGGILGNGRQYMSWIDLDDLVGIILFALQKDSLQGPVNAVAPQPVTNREFTKTLGRVLFRPTCLPMPASTSRMVFGEMADELLLASARVKPSKLEAAGYSFQYPELKNALRHELKNK